VNTLPLHCKQKPVNAVEVTPVYCVIYNKHIDAVRVAKNSTFIIIIIIIKPGGIMQLPAIFKALKSKLCCSEIKREAKKVFCPSQSGRGYETRCAI
jgi:hypothetical protein